MDKIQDLYTQLTINIIQLDNIDSAIENEQDPNQLEMLFENEFMLYMENVGIYEDIMLLIDQEQRTINNEFELARIKKSVQDMIRVEIIEI